MSALNRLRACLPRRVCFMPSFEIGLKVRSKYTPICYVFYIIISYHNIIEHKCNLWIGTSWFDHNPATHSLDHGVYVRPRFVHSIADRRIVPRCWHLTTIFSFQRTKWRRWQRNHAKWKSVSWGNFYDSGKCIKKETMNIIYIFNSILYDTTFDLAKPRGMDDI